MWKFVEPALKLFGGAMKAREEKRQADMFARNQLAQLVAQRENFRLEAPRVRAEQAAFGSGLSNWQPRQMAQLGPESSRFAAPPPRNPFAGAAQDAGAALAVGARGRLGQDDYYLPVIDKYNPNVPPSRSVRNRLENPGAF